MCVSLLPILSTSPAQIGVGIPCMEMKLYMWTISTYVYQVFIYACMLTNLMEYFSIYYWIMYIMLTILYEVFFNLLDYVNYGVYVDKL